MPSSNLKNGQKREGKEIKRRLKGERREGQREEEEDRRQ